MRETGWVTVRVLLLGGTTEARHLAAALVGDPRVHVVSSLGQLGHALSLIHI